MREILIDEASFTSAEEVHAFLARELDFPSHYGANLDALNDCLGDISEPTTVSVFMSQETLDPETDFAIWFPKLVRSLLRASRDNSALDVLVHAGTLDALGRLAACPGMTALLANEAFIVQGIIASLADETV